MIDQDIDLTARIADALDPQPDPYASKPSEWTRDRLKEFVWSKQREILESIRDNRFTAVPSCHSAGKSHIAARAIAHWVETHPIDETFVVSTAPSAPQVKAILWRYLKSLHRKNELRGYITEGEIPEWKMEGRLVGWGRKPADLTSHEDASTAFQGAHAKYLLVVMDEAGGIPEWLWNAVDTLVTAPTNRVLAIGNPDNPSSHFEKVCRPGSGWNVIPISAFDTPNFTGEPVPQDVADNLVSTIWVEERARIWGVESPLYISKVLAQFPESTDDNLIPISWIKNAIERDFSGEAIADMGKFAMDFARQGVDEAVLGWWRGGMFRIIWKKRGVNNSMTLIGRLSNFCLAHPAAVGIVDADGLGGPLFDRARELRLPVSPFYAGRRAFNPRRYVNRRSEQWWMLRELFEAGLVDIDPEDEDLHSQLGSIKYEEDSKGRVSVETKKEMRKRGLPSPDRADTLMMITAPMEEWLEAYKDPETGLYNQENYGQSLTSDLIDKPM